MALHGTWAVIPVAWTGNRNARGQAGMPARWEKETQACSTACNPLCIPGAVRFEGNPKSKELCVLIGMVFPHVALFSHDIPCFQN